MKEKALDNVKELGKDYLVLLMDLLRPIVLFVSNAILPPANHASPRARSRPPALAQGDIIKNAVGDDLRVSRVAKYFDDFFVCGGRDVVRKIE